MVKTNNEIMKRKTSNKRKDWRLNFRKFLRKLTTKWSYLIRQKLITSTVKKVKSIYTLKVRHFQQLLRCRKDRKSTRLNSSHVSISYAVFCLKKKKNN